MDQAKTGMQMLASMPPARRRAAMMLAAAIAAASGVAVLRQLQPKTPRPAKTASSARRRPKYKLDGKFFAQLWRLIKLANPSLWSKTSGILIAHSVFLTARTFLSIYLTNLDGRLVRLLVERKKNNFVRLLIWWLLVSLPCAYTNSMIKFLQSKLSIALRSTLIARCTELYIDEKDVYYRVGNLDSRLSNPDQCLTDDISNWCNQLTELFSNIGKPSLDILLMIVELLSNTGIKSVGIGTTVAWTTMTFLRYIMPPFGDLVAEQGRLEGYLRYVHSRVLQNAEEIAFYRGHDAERGILDEAYKELVKHLNRVFHARLSYNNIEGWMLKYLWAFTGFVQLAIPIFSREQDVGEATQSFVTNRALMTRLADATERLMGSYKEINELAGYTARVTEMLTTFEDCRKHQYKRGQVDRAVGSKNIELGSADSELVVGMETIELENVPIVTPNGDVLVEALTFSVRLGQHCLVTGPNGCGKSSLFRVLGGLWPLSGGKLSRPERGEIFYIPQRPYLPIGSLRFQVTYPNKTLRPGETDADLETIMGLVHLEYIAAREGGWNKVAEWKDLLSGGEKQRVAMARLFYHAPKFAILDECTSAVSVDVEGSMYTAASARGMTLLTVSHRPSLFKYHSWRLHFDGEGNYTFGELAESEKKLDWNTYNKKS